MQGRALDRLLWTVDHGDPAVQVDGSKPAAQYIESINYITKWKVSAFSRAQRDLAHLIRMCASNLKRLRLDGVVFHLPTFFTTLTKDLSLTELRLENVDKTLLAEDLTTVLCSQPKLKSFQLGSDCFEDDDVRFQYII